MFNLCTKNTRFKNEINSTHTKTASGLLTLVNLDADAVVSCKTTPLDHIKADSTVAPQKSDQTQQFLRTARTPD